MQNQPAPDNRFVIANKFVESGVAGVKLVLAAKGETIQPTRRVKLMAKLDRVLITVRPLRSYRHLAVPGRQESFAWTRRLRDRDLEKPR